MRALSVTENTGISVSSPNEKRENLASTGSSTRENDCIFSNLFESMSSETSVLGSHDEFLEKRVKKFVSLRRVKRCPATIL